MEEIIFEIISHGGDARGYAYDALEFAEKAQFDKAEEMLQKSKKELDLAHNSQTKLIQKEINGQDIKINLLIVHAQDQLMTAIAEKNLIEKMVDMYKRMYQKN